MFGSNCFFQDLGILSFLFLLFHQRSGCEHLGYGKGHRNSHGHETWEQDLVKHCNSTTAFFRSHDPRKIGWWNDGGGSLLGKRVSWIVNHLGYLVHFGGKEVVFGFVVECAYGEIRGSLVQSTCWCTNWPVTCFVWDLSAAGCWFLRCYLLFIYLDWRL